MKKIIKILLIAIMLAGISISILNFLPVDLEAYGKMGIWVDGVCENSGDECFLSPPLPK